MIPRIMVPQISLGIKHLESLFQGSRSLTSESRKRNVGGEVLAACPGNGVGIDETFSGPAFRTILIFGLSGLKNVSAI